EHVTQRGRRYHPRSDLLRTLKSVSREIDKGVGQLLKLGRTSCDLEPAELRIDITRSLHGLEYGTVSIGRAVCCKRFGSRRRPHRQRDLGCVIMSAGTYRDLEPCRPGFVG